MEPDFKAEIKAAELVASGVPIDQVVIKATGALHRSLRKDVEVQVTEEDDDILATVREIFYSAREGIYDMLPQNIFHHPSPPKNANEKEILLYFKERKKQEVHARKFFLPFEHSINQSRIFNAYFELTLQQGIANEALQGMFAPYWPIFKLLDAQAAKYFVALLPLLHQLRDNEAAINEIFSSLLGDRITVHLNAVKPQQYEQHVQFGNFFGQRLGVDFIPGEIFYDDGQQQITLEIGPVNKRRASEYLQSQTQCYQLLQSLCDYFLPVELDCTWEIVHSETAHFMRLPAEASADDLVLGHDTVLG